MNNNHEEWRPIVGFPGMYEVSNKGHVRSLNRTVIRNKTDTGHVNHRKGKLLGFVTQKYTKEKYVSLNIDGTKEIFSVAHLVAEAFLGPKPSETSQILHRDGDCNNNAVENLYYSHCFEQTNGSSNKIDKMRQIMNALAEGASITDVAQQFQISLKAAHFLATGEHWTDANQDDPFF